MNVDFPRKLAFLFTPSRYKSARGGRDGGKSWGFAQALVEIASAREAQLKEWGLWCGGPEFIVCARENMNSIADSVHRLLEETIDRLQLQHEALIEKCRIADRTPARNSCSGRIQRTILARSKISGRRGCARATRSRKRSRRTFHSSKISPFVRR